MAITKTDRVNITNRLHPCRCGCIGSDSWHAATFKRVVCQVRDLPADAPREGTKASNVEGLYRVLREGIARFPFGMCRVVEIAVGSYKQVWDGDNFISMDYHDYRGADGELRSSGWWLAACTPTCDGCPGEGCTNSG